LPLTDYVLNCINPYSNIYPSGCPWTSSSTIPSSFADDYRESLKFTNGSVLNQYAQYQTNWFYCDAWGVPTISDLAKLPCEKTNIVDGFDLVHSGDHIYAVQALCPALQTSTNNCYTNGLINYIMVTFVRTLVIQPDGIILEA
jgi:hypothetical protein